MTITEADLKAYASLAKQGRATSVALLPALAAAYLQALADRDESQRLTTEVLASFIELEEVGSRLLGRGIHLQAQLDALWAARGDGDKEMIDAD